MVEKCWGGSGYSAETPWRLGFKGLSCQSLEEIVVSFCYFNYLWHSHPSFLFIFSCSPPSLPSSHFLSDSASEFEALPLFQCDCFDWIFSTMPLDSSTTSAKRISWQWRSSLRSSPVIPLNLLTHTAIWWVHSAVLNTLCVPVWRFLLLVLVKFRLDLMTWHDLVTHQILSDTTISG